MSATSFQTARDYLRDTPRHTWGARLASVAAAVVVVSLVPLAYLFVDHLVWKGAMPTYAGLPPTRQQAFRDRWEKNLAADKDIDATLKRIRPEKSDAYVGEVGRWEHRWQATVYDQLQRKVNAEAAQAYIEFPEAEATDSVRSPTPAERLGVLSLVARQEQTWLAGLLGRFAKWNPWAWTPDADGHANPAYLTGLFLLALCLAVLYAICRLAAEYWAAAASLDAITRLRRAVFAHANRLGVLATKRHAADEVATVFVDRVAALEGGFRHMLTGGLRGPVQFLLLLALSLATNVWLAVGLLALAAFVWLVAGQVAANFRRDGRLAARRVEVRLAQMRESLSMLQLVRSYLMERFNQTRVERQLTDFTRAEWRRLRGNALSGPLLTGVVLAAAVVMLYVGGRSVLGGDLSTAALAMKLVALAAMVPAVRAWVEARTQVRLAREASADVVEFLDRRVDAGQPIDAEFLQPMERKLEFIDVSYREPGTGRMVLENLSLSIPKQSRVVVVGSDADEVRTFAYLLTRFVDPTAGEVRIDGKNLRWVTHESLRTQVALVTQQALTFNDTVANNIGCGDAGFALPQIIDAAKLAHAHQFVQRLPHGYETAIGDGGASLRPGEKLRIAIARGILRDPSLLVVEESDTPLDHDTKALLDDTFARLQTSRALVILSRRSSVLKSADQVLVLHHGRIAATGTHAELMQHNELYRNILFQEMPVLAATA